MHEYQPYYQSPPPPRRRGMPLWLVLPLLLLTLGAGAGAGYYAALRTTTPCPLDRETCQRFGNFWRAWEIARANYVDPAAIDPERMTDGAIAGMLDSLGDEGHTRYLSAEDAKREAEALSGRFEGIGAYVNERDGRIILQPIEGSPAERAGIKPGDTLLKVDGVDVTTTEVGEITPRVRGPRGTSVVLTVRHEGAELPNDITVVREEIKFPSVLWRMLPDNIAHIRLTQFSDPAPEEMRKALAEAQQQGARAIVLDLRNNPGGLLRSLIKITGEFVPEGTVVLLEQSRDGARTPYKTDQVGVAQTIPVVVLVNNYTASSGEILAGALQEQGRAKVVGVPTFGTATVLRPFALDDGAQVRLGTTQWLTPRGEVVRGKGITPDEIISLEPGAQIISPTDAAQSTIESLLTGEDKQFARAIELLGVTAAR